MRERKLTPREVIARSYPSWDFDMADRLIAWLEHCGYEILPKQELCSEGVSAPRSNQSG